jgi:chromosome segregation ATPase
VSEATWGWVAAAVLLVGNIAMAVFSRKKNNAEATFSISQGAAQAVETLTRAVERLEVELNETREELSETRQELHEARAEVEELRRKLDRYERRDR